MVDGARAKVTWRMAWQVAIGVWLLAAVAVWLWMTQYACTGYLSRASESPACWPTESELESPKNRPALLFFAHPHCPCTLASLQELARLLSNASLSSQQQPTVTIVATVPHGASASWYQSKALRCAAELPNVQIYWDVGGQESSRFGASISGTSLLYSAQGQLLFCGGITVSRGHEGASLGSDRILNLLTASQPSRQPSTPVFGCKLCLEQPDQSDEAAIGGVQ